MNLLTYSSVKLILCERGIFVGTREDQQDLCAFLEEKKIDLKPLVDRVFKFEESADAFEYLYSGAHTGKVVIKI